MKKVLQVLPEGVMIYKRFGNPHIKLWNNELEKLFKFNALPVKIGRENDESSNSMLIQDGKKVNALDDLD